MTAADHSPWWTVDHVPVATPRGGADVARGVDAVKLGIPEAPKPPVLAARGGCRSESGAARTNVGGPDARFEPIEANR